jgi:hypothetical protein
MLSFGDECRTTIDRLGVVQLVNIRTNGPSREKFGAAIKLDPSTPAIAHSLSSLLRAIGAFVVKLSCLAKLQEQQVLVEAITTQCVSLECLDLKHCSLTSLDVGWSFRCRFDANWRA